ncbi:MAG TPA: nucleoside 2-deoxyribosyltransferase [Candidatus Nanoarchaeia archaeon]|nr:nucleoside 2-deoxyribosyltransferase [Candidatus Nanoarchaeia archaeon]
MNAYLAIKFSGEKNRNLIEEICSALQKAKINTTVMVRDYEQWGKKSFSLQELMKLTFSCIDKANILIVELSEKGVGLGIEAGYAHARNKPIIVIAKTGSDISKTLQGIAQEIIFYNNPADLVNSFALFQKEGGF